MKKKLASVLFALLLVCSILNLAISLTPSTQPVSTVLSAQSVEYRGAKLYVTVPATCTTDAIPLEAHLTCDSNASFSILQKREFLSCKLNLRSENGRAVLFSKAGNDVFNGGRRVESSAITHFEKGRSGSWEYNLAEAYEPLAPGKYLLSLKAYLHLPGKTQVEIEATDIPFEIQ